MLKTVVKASSVSNLTDARYFSAWLIEWLGFDLSPSGLEILPLAAVKEIKDWIEGPQIIGELEVLDINEAQQLIDFLELKNIQVGMHTPVETLNSLQVNCIIKEVVIEPSSTFETIMAHLNLYFDYVDYFLFDFTKNNIDWNSLKNNKDFNTKDLQKLCELFQIFLAINFTTENTQDILEIIQPLGISVKGGVEEKIGFKSFDQLDEIFELLEEE